MNFIHFGLRMKIEKLYLEWCAEEGIANKPNSMVVFLMEKGWLNEEQIIKDLNELKTEPQMKYKKWEMKPAINVPTENTTCVGIAMALVENEPIIEVYNGNADKENWQCITIKPIEDEPQTQKPCDNCQEFDCYGCEYKQMKGSE